MAEAIILVQPSYELAKALVINSQATQPMQTLRPLNHDPMLDVNPASPTQGLLTEGFNGVWSAGYGGLECAYRLFVQPYANGDAGSLFWMRLWGWRPIGNDPSTFVWVNHLLVELACKTGEIPGPSNDSDLKTNRTLLKTERLCDTIGLVRGSVGTGEIVSDGGNYPAHALIDLRGCRRFQFEFQQNDDPAVITMNALWARN